MLYVATAQLANAGNLLFFGKMQKCIPSLTVQGDNDGQKARQRKKSSNKDLGFQLTN